MECLRWFEQKKEVESNEIIRLINNYLSSYKSFNDSWKTYIDRNKDMQNFYKRSIVEIAEENFEYRFIYNLRNYVQHCNKPVSSIKCSLNNKAKITLSCEKFLKEHNGMQTKFRKELENSNIVELNVDESIRTVYMLLTEIQMKLVNKILNSLDDYFLSASIKVVDFYKKYNTNGGKLGLINSFVVEEITKINSETGNVNFEIFNIPYDVARMVIKGKFIKFKFTGINIGSSNDFPIQYKLDSPIQMPQFKTRNEFVVSRGIKWVRIIESTGCKYKDGYDRYFSVYVPMGLLMSDYYEIEQKFKTEEESFFR